MQRFCGWMRPLPIAIWIASLCALLTTVIVRAQAPPSAPGPPIIRSIEVEYTGPASISKERILAQMRTKVGQLYSNEIVQEDIKALYTNRLRSKRSNLCSASRRRREGNRCRSNPGDLYARSKSTAPNGSNRKDCAKRSK